jgi:hypothetical protein
MARLCGGSEPSTSIKVTCTAPPLPVST